MTMTPIAPPGFDQTRDLALAYLQRVRHAPSEDDARRDFYATQEAITFTHLGDMWSRGQAEFVVLTPDVVEERIEHATTEKLSSAERDLVVERVMNDPVVEDLLKVAQTKILDVIGRQIARVVEDRGE